jgi:hypothetical protein
MAGIALTLLEIRVLGHVAHAADEHGACRRTVSEVHGRRVRVLATPLGPLDRIELPAEVHGKAFTLAESQSLVSVCIPAITEVVTSMDALFWLQGVSGGRQLGFLGGERARLTCCVCLCASLVVKLLVSIGTELSKIILLVISVEHGLAHGIAPAYAVVPPLGEDLLLEGRAAGWVLAAGLLDLTFLILDGSLEPELTCGRVHTDDAGLALCPLTCFLDRLADAASARAWLTDGT